MTKELLPITIKINCEMKEGNKKNYNMQYEDEIELSGKGFCVSYL